MTKTKKYILTETGEVRCPKEGDYFMDGLNRVKYANIDFVHDKYPILKLEVIEEAWKPKEGEMYFLSVPTNDDLYNVFHWNKSTIEVDWLERGLIFKTKEEAIEVSKKILEFIKTL